MNKERVLGSLLSSIAGVLIFLALEQFVDLNGFTKYSPLIILSGVLLLMFPGPILKLTKSIGVLNRPLVFTLSHILIFIGSKAYLDQFIDNFWFTYLLLGVILLNYADTIAKKLYG